MAKRRRRSKKVKKALAVCKMRKGGKVYACRRIRRKK